MFLKAENINFEYTVGKKVLNGVSFILNKSKTLSLAAQCFNLLAARRIL